MFESTQAHQHPDNALETLESANKDLDRYRKEVSEKEDGLIYSLDGYDAEGRKSTRYREAESARADANDYFSQLERILKPDSEDHGLKKFKLASEQLAALEELENERDLENIRAKAGQGGGFSRGYDLRRAASAYLMTREFGQKSQEVFQGNKEILKLWEEIRTLHEEFQVDPENERAFLGGVEDDKKEASVRSFKNIRKTLSLFYRQRKMDGMEPEAIIQELREKQSEIRDSLEIVYVRHMGDIQKILDDGAIKTLSELSPTEQDGRRKSERSLSEIVRDRREIEEALGWQQDAPVYHLLVQNAAEREYFRSPGYDYGSIQFEFDFDEWQDRMTFTEGDSLNTVGIPNGLSKYGSVTKKESAQQRQIIGRHVPLAKAAFDLLPDHGDFSRHLRYIEAQVGNISGAELLRHVKAIHVDQEESRNEWRSAQRRGVAHEDTSYEDVLTRLEVFAADRGVKVHLFDAKNRRPGAFK